MRLVVRPAAALDIGEAYAWYQLQRSGLGEEFLAALNARRDRILDYPAAYPVLHRDTRCALLPRRFPYAIFYRYVDGSVVIVACMHARRNPRHWQRRR